MRHELWLESDGEQTSCLAGSRGEGVRALLSSNAKLVWEVEANSYFEAMSKYYEYMGWGEYQTDFPEQDKKTYKQLGWEQPEFLSNFSFNRFAPGVQTA